MSPFHPLEVTQRRLPPPHSPPPPTWTSPLLCYLLSLLTHLQPCSWRAKVPSQSASTPTRTQQQGALHTEGTRCMFDWFRKVGEKQRQIRLLWGYFHSWPRSQKLHQAVHLPPPPHHHIHTLPTPTVSKKGISRFEKDFLWSLVFVLTLELWKPYANKAPLLSMFTVFSVFGGFGGEGGGTWGLTS